MAYPEASVLQTQFPIASIFSSGHGSLQNHNSSGTVLLIAQQSTVGQQAQQKAEKINKNIENRYGGALEHADQSSDGVQKTRLLDSHKLLKELDPELVPQQPSTLKANTQAESSSLLGPFLNLPLPWQVASASALAIGVIGCSIPIVKIVRRQLNKAEDVQKAFDEGAGKSLQVYLAKDKKELAWWDQPRWGDKSACQHLISTFYKPPVPEGMVFVHNRELEHINPLAKQVISVDQEKFTSKEFITYLKIRIELLHGNTSDATGMQRSAKLLRAALAAKRYFEQIWQVEMRYLSSKQQEVYRFVDDLLKQKVYDAEFRHQLQNKLELTLPDVKSEEGKNALNSYVKALSGLSEYEFGLELLELFKQYQLADYVVLRTVDELLAKLKRLDLTDSKVLKPDIMLHFEAFEQLAPIIQMPRNRVDPDSFTALVHFMVLEVKHQASYGEFSQLTAILEKWAKPYQRLLEVRAGYSSKDYRLPKEFCLDIPGLHIYQKYESVLKA
jgi:hypothetical protein